MLASASLYGFSNLYRVNIYLVYQSEIVYSTSHDCQCLDYSGELL